MVMKKTPNNKGVLSLLLRNSILQFIAGLLSLLIVLRFANSMEYQLIQLVLKALGYGFFCYSTTPFMIYWLAYVSQGVFNAKKLALTVVLTAIYSYLIWDAYFFFRGAIAALFSNVSY
ncbi:MAG: hypothetical protein AAFQ80_04310 [Cyanobacteria bacterium J06621_8]